MQFLALVAFIAISELAGGVGSLFTLSAIPGWYANLAKPALNPQNWVFGPVWTALYLLMDIAAFLVWRKGFARAEARREMRRAVRTALIIFGIQLVLNAAWSAIFFGAHSPGGALLTIILLWLAILATIITFYKISPAAAYLLLPYIIWVSFAAYLNFGIWRLN